MQSIFTIGVRRPVASFTLVLLAVVFSLAQVPGAVLDPSPEQIYPKDSPRARFAAEHQERFGREDDVIFAVREGDPFSVALEDFAQQLEATEMVADVQTPGRAQVLQRDADDVLITAPLQPGDDVPLWIEKVLISEDGQAGAALVSLEPEFNDHQGRKRILAEVEDALGAAGGTWHLSGMPMVRLEYVETMGRDLNFIVPLSVAVASIFFWLTFRDWRHVLLGVAAIGSGALCAAGAHIATGTPFNVFAVAFLTVVVVVGTSDLVHLVHRFSDHFAELQDPREAALRAAREVGAACLLTSTTTAVGFFALLTTIIPPIRVFGLATGFGVLITYVIGFLLVPPVLAWIGPPAMGARRHAADAGERMKRLGRWTLNQWRPLLVVWAVIVAVCAALAARVEVDYRMLDHLAVSHEYGQDHGYMEDHLGGVLPLEVDIQLPSSALTPDALAAVEALTDWMRAQPAVGHALALPDVIRPAWKALSGDDGLPPSTDAAAQTALMMEMGGRELMDGLRVIEGDGRERTRIVARVRDVGNQKTLALVDDLNRQAAVILGPVGGTATVTGVAYLIQEVNTTLTEQFAGSFAIALVVIGLMWLVGTRSAKRTFLALLPNAMPLFMVLAFMGAFDIALKPSTAMVLSIGLGIAVDDTIHFLSAYERTRRSGGSVEDGVLHAFATAGRSMFDTSVMIGLGFGCLVLARSPENNLFGLLAAWVVGCAVLCDLFMLPPLLRWLDHAERSVRGGDLKRITPLTGQLSAKS
ncbi:MAG: MMPL family transporter [Myxococcota bacterium]